MNSFAAAVLAFGVAVAPGFAQDVPKDGAGAPVARPRAGHPKMMDHLDKALDLTPDQKTKVDAIRAKHQPVLESKRRAAQEAQKAFATAMRNPDTKAEDLKTLHRAMSDAGLEALLEARSQHQEVRALLTPEQREKAARLEGRMEGRRMGPRGGFPEGGMR